MTGFISVERDGRQARAIRWDCEEKTWDALKADATLSVEMDTNEASVVWVGIEAQFNQQLVERGRWIIIDDRVETLSDRQFRRFWNVVMEAK